jgi:hypothetical protein
LGKAEDTKVNMRLELKTHESFAYSHGDSISQNMNLILAREEERKPRNGIRIII